ncbi:MAG TPA: VWA domain-containing protein [Gemmatimonadaceae bacterium]|nr:VWA domain-containing protein [Gemmatimonadaceae bacterium]
MMQVFDWPWMAVVSVVAAIAMAWLVRSSFKRRIMRVSRLGTRQLVMRLVPEVTLRLPRGRSLRLGLAALLAAIALAGPRWGEEATVLRGEGIDVVLALDASLSMLATDERPSRLERLKQEVRRLRAASKGDRFALLAFAGRSYILSPLTVDDGALDLFLDNLDPSIVGQAGSAISRAISQGTELLQASRSAGDRALVVMSDGEAFESSQEIVLAAERAAKAGIAVVTVGFGTTEGSTIPIRNGDRVDVKRDENNEIVVTKYVPETLRAAADAAQGTFIDAAETDKATRIRRALQTLRTTARQVESGRSGTPRFQLFLLPALLLIIADTLGSVRRRRVAASARTVPAAAAGLVMLANGCALPGAQATRAADQFAGGQYARAAASYRDAISDGDERVEMLYNLGTALVAADSLDRSLEPLERATLSEKDELRYRALFNLGLAQLEIGRAGARNADSTRRALATAVELYKRVLLMRPGDGDAQWNYELALTELDRQSSGGSSQQQNNPDPQPQQGDPPPPSLGRDQAEQLLSSAARDEQAVQGRKQRESRPTTPRRGKDW